MILASGATAVTLSGSTTRYDPPSKDGVARPIIDQTIIFISAGGSQVRPGGGSLIVHVGGLPVTARTLPGQAQRPSPNGKYDGLPMTAGF